MERYNGAVAEIVKIHEEVLVKLLDSLEVAMTIAREEGLDPESVYERILDCTRLNVREFYDLLVLPLGKDILVMNSTVL